MPVTQGSGNPIWTWDETLLALDLLYRHGKPIDKAHDDIGELSTLLRAASIYPAERRKDNFRNADGVALKLQNLFSVVQPGRRLSSSKTDKEVVAAYPISKRGELSTVATAIRAQLQAVDVVDADADEETFKEGSILTARHRRRERRLRVALLKRAEGKPLQCSVCDFTPPAVERKAQESFFEAHHLVPLGWTEGEIKTRASDATLICACCHRFVHHLIAAHGEWITMDDARRARLVPAPSPHCP